ncbi:MAG: hypothetical protein ABIK89_13285 [Planctomycetota bacterium]
MNPTPKEASHSGIPNNPELYISDAEIDDLYEKFLLEVELVQIEQKALLRCLIEHHRLRRVFCEGLTKEDMLFYKLKIAALRRVEKQIPEVKDQIEEAACTLAEMEKAGDEDSDDYRLAAAIKAEFESLLYQHRLDLLRVGAAGQLFMAGELEEVVPVDDEELLARAYPVTEDGKVNLDQEVIEARQDAQVRAMIEAGRFALVILGGAHDLADNVRKLVGHEGDYVRVTTKWGQRFGVEDPEQPERASDAQPPFPPSSPTASPSQQPNRLSLPAAQPPHTAPETPFEERPT